MSRGPRDECSSLVGGERSSATVLRITHSGPDGRDAVLDASSSCCAGVSSSYARRKCPAPVVAHMDRLPAGTGKASGKRRSSRKTDSVGRSSLLPGKRVVTPAAGHAVSLGCLRPYGWVRQGIGALSRMRAGTGKGTSLVLTQSLQTRTTSRNRPSGTMPGSQPVANWIATALCSMGTPSFDKQATANSASPSKARLCQSVASTRCMRPRTCPATPAIESSCCPPC